MTDPSPLLLHLSARPSGPDSNIKWLSVNIVFKLTNELDIELCDSYSGVWSRSILYEVEDVKSIEEYYLHTEYNFKRIDGSNYSRIHSVCTDPKYDISDKIRHGWSLNPFNLLIKTKFPGIYAYRDYVEDNDVTRAALSTIEKFKLPNPHLTSRFVPFSTFSRCLLTLHTFWD